MSILFFLSGGIKMLFDNKCNDEYHLAVNEIEIWRI